MVIGRESILVVAAHPDDAEIGMGGTLASLSRAGYRVVVVDLTDGEPTPFGSVPVRAAEASEAAAILGFEREQLSLPNREVFDTVAYRKVLATLLRKHRPTTLFAPLWEDAHPDHVQASQLADASRFYAKFVKSDMAHQPWYPRRVLYYYATHHRTRIPPAFLFDISTQMELKMQALRAYRSQFQANPANQGVLERIRLDNSYWGGQAGVSFAEPFASREVIRLTTVESLVDA